MITRVVTEVAKVTEMRRVATEIEIEVAKVAGKLVKNFMLFRSIFVGHHEERMTTIAAAVGVDMSQLIDTDTMVVTRTEETRRKKGNEVGTAIDDPTRSTEHRVGQVVAQLRPVGPPRCSSLGATLNSNLSFLPKENL